MNLSSFDDVVNELSAASNEALDIFFSVFNLSQGESPARTGGELFFGSAEGFNATEFSKAVRGQLGGIWYTFRGFIAAVDWTEPWIIGLCVFHLVVLLVAILSRKKNTVQIILFCAITASVYAAETLNSVLAKNWKKFSRQNYFDKHGVFVSSMWSTPLLIVAIVMLLHSLYSASSLLVQVKRKQLMQRGRELAREAAEAKKQK